MRLTDAKLSPKPHNQSPTLNSSVAYDHHQPHPGQSMSSDSEQGSDFLMKKEIKLGTKSKQENHTKKQT